MLGASLLLPVIPYVVRSYRTDALTIGLLSLAYSAAQFLSTPVLGALSDRVGRRPVLLLCIFGSACCYFLFGFATSLAMLFASRILDGLTGGNISTAQAAIADLSRPEDRARNFGLIGAAFGLGFILGPAFGGALSHITLQTPAIAAGCVSLTTFCTAYFLLPETHPKDKREPRPFGLRQLNPFGHIGAPLRQHTLRWLLPGLFMLHLAMSGLQSNFSLYTLTRFGFTPAQNATVLVFLGVVAVATQGGIVRPVLNRVPEARLASEALLISVVGYSLLAWCPHAWVLYVAVGTVAVGNSMAMPSLQAFLSKQADAGAQGTLLGVAASLASLARVIGPVIAGLTFDHFAPSAPYWCATLFVACGLLLVRAGNREAHARAAA